MDYGPSNDGWEGAAGLMHAMKLSRIYGLHATLEQILSYMYTGVVHIQKATVKEVKLLVAADKYEVLELKERLESRLGVLMSEDPFDSLKSRHPTRHQCHQVQAFSCWRCLGGVMWFEEFTASAAEMPSYLSVLDLLKYRHLHWSLTPPKTMIGKPASTVILHCLLEKPMRKDL
ncbi:unnamed protein product [Closterium sp. Yama58-4]|nr:unnamed protein product [Closterium sp. Yama58-4]